MTGVSENDINLWRSVTMRALGRKDHSKAEIEPPENEEIRDDILRWMEAYFDLTSGGNDLAQVRTELIKIVDLASKLLLEIRKNSCIFEIRLHFVPNGEFQDNYMEDITKRDHDITPSGVKLVVTPALLRSTGPSGDRLASPKVLKKAKVLLQA